MSFNRPIIPLHIQHSYIYTWHNSPGFFSPLANSPLCPLLLTWIPPSCNRNRPPRSQVACKLTPFAPPFTQLSPPSKFPETQLPRALLRRPREYSGSCYPEHVYTDSGICCIYIVILVHDMYVDKDSGICCIYIAILVHDMYVDTDSGICTCTYTHTMLYKCVDISYRLWYMNIYIHADSGI